MNKLARLLAILAIASLLACTTEKTDVVVKEAKVTASNAYLDLFGSPPKVRAGQAQALAGYLPSSDGKSLVTFPLFMIGEEERIEAMVQQLLSITAASDFMPKGVLPFPEGLELLNVEREKRVLRLSLASSSDTISGTAFPAALSHSLIQFPSIDRVSLSFVKKGTSDSVPVTVEQRPAVDPGKPDILFAAAAEWRDDGSPEELSIYFDRPIRVEEFSLSLKNSTAIPGDYYTSAFDMAVVVHPGEEAALLEGVELQVKWQIVDARGRSASGNSLLPLRRVEHL